MKQTRTDIMGMPITVEIVGESVPDEHFAAVFAYFEAVDARFSTYKNGSEITRINRGEISKPKQSPEMSEVFALAEKTKEEANGYFDIKNPDGLLDPSGIVKGWAIQKAANLLEKRGVKNFYIDAGGDIEARGVNDENQPWKIGIRNPFKPAEIVKNVQLSNAGIATSGTYIRGFHIYNPRSPETVLDEIVSISVIGPNIYEADRFATAAFAMGRQGILFIESLDGLEGYSIDAYGQATYTSNFNNYVI